MPRSKWPQWLKGLLSNSQPILIALQQQIAALTLQLQNSAAPQQPRGLGKMTSVVIDREIGDWHRFSNRRQIASYTGLCPGEYSSGNTRLQSCVTKHGNLRLRAPLVELAWRLARFQPNYHPVRKWRQILARSRGAHWPPERHAKKRSWQWHVSWPSICGESKPAGSRRRVGINQLISSRGTERRTRLKEIKTLWNAGAARCLTCSKNLCERRLRLDLRPRSSSTLIALIKWC